MSIRPIDVTTVSQGLLHRARHRSLSNRSAGKSPSGLPSSDAPVTKSAGRHSSDNVYPPFAGVRRGQTDLRSHQRPCLPAADTWAATGLLRSLAELTLQPGLDWHQNRSGSMIACVLAFVHSDPCGGCARHRPGSTGHGGFDRAPLPIHRVASHPCPIRRFDLNPSSMRSFLGDRRHRAKLFVKVEEGPNRLCFLLDTIPQCSVSSDSYPSGTFPPIHNPFFFDAAILSRMRSAVTSRSNWAKDRSTFNVSRPMLVAVLNAWVTETNDAPAPSSRSTSFAKSVSDRVSRSIL